MKSRAEHQQQVAHIAQQIAAFSQHPSEKKLRFYHGSTNSTRMQHTDKYEWIDISQLNQVIEVNSVEKYAWVEPNVPMDTLVAKTLESGLVPPVVMEFPGITVGGGINGATLESSSFHYGQFADNCLSYEIICGNGEVIAASAKENSDIFYGMSGAYGSLGLVSLIKVALIPAKKFIETTYTPVGNYQDTLENLHAVYKDKSIEYAEAIIFDPNHGVLITGQQTEQKSAPLHTYTKARDPWFYETAKKVATSGRKKVETILLVDYLFRYNRGAFWMGEYFFPIYHIPNNRLSKFILNPLLNTRKFYDGLHAVNISQNYFIQDFYIPEDQTQKFLEYSEKELGIFPIWLCPVLPTTTPQQLSPHYNDTAMMIDVGVWGQTEKFLKDPIGMNKQFETYVKNIHGRKMLYAHAYYSEKEFWNIYDPSWYEKLRKKYHATSVFPTVWDKVHVAEKYQIHRLKGSLRLLMETIQGKHLNT